MAEQNLQIHCIHHLSRLLAFWFLSLSPLYWFLNGEQQNLCSGTCPLNICSQRSLQRELGVRTVNIPFTWLKSHDLSQYSPALLIWISLFSSTKHTVLFPWARKTYVESTLKMWMKLHKLKMKTKLPITCEKRTHSQICKVSENWPSLQLFSGSSRICSYKMRE